MNIQTKMPTTADEFLRWNEGREGKREFVRGKVVEIMINVTRAHAILATRLLVALMNRLDLTRFEAGSADFGVKTRDGIRYPDVFVDRVSPQSKGTDLSATAPVFLAEVLSTTSYDRDFGEKVEDYTSLSSLEYYVILSQAEARAWLWSRSNDRQWLGPISFAGREMTLVFSQLGVSVPMSDLYAMLDVRSGE